MSSIPFRLRTATYDDAPAITGLIARSIRTLGAQHYPAEQIEAALKSAFGLDSQLLRDETYFVAEAGDALAGCGGWSHRHTLFGGDQRAERDPQRLDPATDAARIRAFFVHPDFARRGLGTMILEACEAAARDAGFTRLELMSTLPGLPFYARHGYAPGTPIAYPLGDGLEIEFVPMCRNMTPL